MKPVDVGSVLFVTRNREYVPLSGPLRAAALMVFRAKGQEGLKDTGLRAEIPGPQEKPLTPDMVRWGSNEYQQARLEVLLRDLRELGKQ